MKENLFGHFSDAIGGGGDGQQNSFQKKIKNEWQINRDGFPTADGIPADWWWSRHTPLWLHGSRALTVVDAVASCKHSAGPMNSFVFFFPICTSCARTQHQHMKIARIAHASHFRNDETKKKKKTNRQREK